MYGMSEEQFWRSNPRIIHVWEQAWKAKENRMNGLVYAYIGNYELSALYTAIDGVLNGKKAKAKYIEKPIRIFELTEEERIQEQEKARQAFVMWAGFAENKYKEKGG